jgi:hypothetical protein
MENILNLSSVGYVPCLIDRVVDVENITGGIFREAESFKSSAGHVPVIWSVIIVHTNILWFMLTFFFL